MGTTADKLNRLISTKKGIRQEINRAYGTEEIINSDTFNSYIQKLEEHPFYLKGLVEGTIESIKLSNVTSLGNGAFYGCSSLKEVSFPNAKSTGAQAFQYCISLIEITDASFPKATYIDSSAFEGCSSLTKVSFPKATGINLGAFGDCSSLTEVSIPNVTDIGQAAFSGCSSLTEVSFPKATGISSYAFSSCSSLTEATEASFPLVTSIGQYAFDHCSSLTRVSFPKVTYLGDTAFRECSNLTSVSIPKATKIDSRAFYKCSKLTSVSFPEATSIGSSAFNYCSGLTKVSFPNATSIGGSAFSSCSSLTEVSIPNATSIGDNAFNSCSGLTSVSFPEVTSIGSGAFQNCSGLTTIYVGTESDTVCTLSNTNAIPSSVTDIYVPYSLVDSYKSATNWSTFASKIKANIQPVECITLSITADDVIGNATSTTVHYTAECTYTKEGVLQEGTKVFTGEATSDSFEQNTSTTDTIQREVSFTFLGKTATTTITQGVWINQSISVTTEGISDYGWVTADSNYNVDGYDVYMSNNKGANSSQAVMKLECVGYTELTIYIRSYAESSYDYTIASNANASAYPTAYNDSTAKAHTSGNQSSGTTLSDYTAVTYTGLKDNDIIYIVFRKDSSAESGDDRGYVLIPKQS